jgi:predicted lipoprotein with Yx(FWY)xxD motif
MDHAMHRTRPAGEGRRGGLLPALAAALVMALAAGSLPAFVATAQEGDAVTVGTATDELGTYLVGPTGMTLYYFTRDVTPGVSACAGPCAEAWPPLLVEEGQELVAGEGVTGPLGVVPRADGTMMATYRGRPLYHWASDQEPGDTTGHGVFNVWFVALVDGSSPANPPALALGVAEGEAGPYLVGAEGRSVYLFTRDETPGASVCEGDCLDAWPPVTVPAGNTAVGGEGVPGVVGLIPAANGALQVTYDGRPLYYFAGDAEAGDTNGHGVNDVWFLVEP